MLVLEWCYYLFSFMKAILAYQQTEMARPQDHVADPAYQCDIKNMVRVVGRLKLKLYGGAVRDFLSGDPIVDLDVKGEPGTMERLCMAMLREGFFIGPKKINAEYSNVTRLQFLRPLRHPVSIDFSLSTDPKDVDFDVNGLVFDAMNGTTEINPNIFRFGDYNGLSEIEALGLVTRNIHARRCVGTIQDGPHFMFRYFKMKKKGYNVELEFNILKLVAPNEVDGVCLVCQEPGNEDPVVQFKCACKCHVHLKCLKTMCGYKRRLEDVRQTSARLVRVSIDGFSCAFASHYERWMYQSVDDPSDEARARLQTADAEALTYEDMLTLEPPLPTNKCLLCKKCFPQEKLGLELLYLELSGFV
jgi:hypothetical protein